MSDSTEHKQAINRAIDEFGLREHCLFLGNKSDVENYYPLCTLTVLPSLFEGTPNVLLESMACGTPVVASNVSDNAYLVRDGETGYIVPVNDEASLADRVHAILSDDRLRSRMSSAGRNWMVLEFSCRRLAEKTAAAYRDALAVRRGNPAVRPASPAAQDFAPAHRESTLSE